MFLKFPLSQNLQTDGDLLRVFDPLLRCYDNRCQRVCSSLRRIRRVRHAAAGGDER